MQEHGTWQQIIIYPETLSGNKAHGDSSYPIRSWKEKQDMAEAIIQSDPGTRNGRNHHLIRNWIQEQGTWQRAFIQSETITGNKTRRSSHHPIMMK